VKNNATEKNIMQHGKPLNTTRNILCNMKYNIDKLNTAFVNIEYNNVNQMKHRLHHKKIVNIKINNDKIKSKMY